MAKKKADVFRVILGATLPCTATLYVEAKDEDFAREYAERHFIDANWSGADYNTPSGCYVEIIRVEKL